MLTAAELSPAHPCKTDLHERNAVHHRRDVTGMKVRRVFLRPATATTLATSANIVGRHGIVFMVAEYGWDQTIEVLTGAESIAASFLRNFDATARMWWLDRRARQAGHRL